MRIPGRDIVPAAAALLLAAGPWACDDGGTAPQWQPDGGTDSDTDADGDGDADGDADLVGALLRGTHHTVLDYGPGNEAGVLWIPLPIDFATQTPLHVELIASPDGILGDLGYEVDDIGNLGAVVELTTDVEQDDVSVHWDGVVLTLNVTSAERPVFYAADADPAEWTVATPVADAAYPGIADTAAGLAEGAGTALEKMVAVINWTSANIAYATDWTGFTGFDATSTYEWGQSSCTGFANLATALGRATGVPTRTVANYYVGMSQQTHYINEFYLGEELGWRRVEPQTTWPALPESYALVVRLVRISDEGEEAMIASDPTDAPGIPTYSLVEELAGGERMALDYMSNGYFEDCPACDNRADLQADLWGAAAEMADLFDRARELWQRDLQELVDGTLDPAVTQARRNALEAETLDDVAAILDAID